MKIWCLKILWIIKIELLLLNYTLKVILYILALPIKFIWRKVPTVHLLSSFLVYNNIISNVSRKRYPIRMFRLNVVWICYQKADFTSSCSGLILWRLLGGKIRIMMHTLSSSLCRCHVSPLSKSKWTPQKRLVRILSIVVHKWPECIDAPDRVRCTHG